MKRASERDGENEEGKGGAMQDYEKDDKVSSDVRMGTDEYGEEREDEVRCHAWGGGKGGAQWVQKRTGSERSIKVRNVIMY